MHPFFTSTSRHGIVVANFRRDPIGDLSAFAMGYHNAARALVERMESANGYYDYDGYPIVFLYRHALELYLKTIVYRGAKLLALISNRKIKVDKLWQNHSLTALLPDVKAIIEDLDWDEDLGIAGIHSFDDFSNLVTEINNMDPQSYNFRYPINKKGDSPLTKHFIVNVVGFGKNMDQLLEVLDGMVTALDQYWQDTAEAFSNVADY